MDYIYHKKPDGSIEQIEVTEENKAEKLHMYNLEKQLQEQRGEDFGKIYKDGKSLKDEDKIKVGLMTQKEYDAKQIEVENAKIKAELAEIDQNTIRGLREYLIELTKDIPEENAPDFIKAIRNHEAEAIESRKKLK